MKLRLWSKLAFCALTAGLSAAHAADYPTRMVRMVVPSTPGTAPDIIARLVGERLSASLGQQVMIENKPGGNGILAMNALKQTKPDGYTIMLFHAAAAITTPIMYKEAKFDIERDTDMVGTIAYTPMMFVANKESPYKTLADVVAAGKAKPDDLAFGNPNYGSIPHLTAELMAQITGAQFRQINFAGTTQAIQSVVGGDVPVYVDGVAPLVPLVDSGRLRALAVAADTQLPGLEEIPLAKDTVPGLVATGWFVLLAPKDTPSAMLDRLHADLGNILAQPDFAARIRELGTYPMPKSRADAEQFVRDEKALWHGVIDKAGVKPQ